MARVISIPSTRLWKHYGRRFSSHGAGRHSGSESERQEKVKEGVKKKTGGGTAEMLLLAIFSGKDLALCVSFIV